HSPLCVDRGRHVGDQVAVVIADSKRHAAEAAALVDVDYEELPAAVTIKEAIAEDAPLVWDQAPGHTCYDWELGDAAAAEAALAKAHKVVALDLGSNRVVPNASEPRAASGAYEPATGDSTLYTSSQNPHLIRLLMGAFVLHLPEHKLRVIAPDV